MGGWTRSDPCAAAPTQPASSCSLRPPTRRPPRRPHMEEKLRSAAGRGDEAALKALLDAKVVNIDAGDEVSGWGE